MAVKRVIDRLSLVDRVLVVFVGLLVLGSFALFTVHGRGQKVVIEQGGKVVFTGKLSSVQTVKIEGPLGETVVRLEGKKVHIPSSPCPAKICVRSGHIHRPGELLACVPNRVIVRVEGEAKNEEDYDILSR